MNKEYPDNLSHAGATALALKIRDYWAKRGLMISVVLEPFGDGPMYGIRSDINLGSVK